MIKAMTLILEDNGSCKIIKGDDKPEHFNHYGNACVWLQKECEKFVAEQRMERGVKAKKELDDAQGDT